MLRIILIAGATLVFVGAFASTGSAKAIDPAAASKAAFLTLGAVSDAAPMVISVRTGESRPQPAPPRPRPTSTRTRTGKK